MMRRPLRSAIAISTTAFLCGLAPVAAFAQTPVASQSSGSSPTAFIPVIVTDRQGSPVTGLDQFAFGVREGDRNLPITSFAVESGPLGLVLVVDASVSVGDTEIAHVREIIQRLLQSAHPDSEFFLVGVAGRVWPVGWTRDRANISRVFDELTQLRQAARRDRSALPTPLHEGILRALEAAEGSRYRKRAVIIVSDGMDTSSWVPRSDVEEALRRTSAVAYSMLFRSSPGPGGRSVDTSLVSLRRSVEETGGREFHPRTAGDWEAASDRILADLRHLYVIGVQPNASRRGWRRVSVVLASSPDQGITVRSRTGYLLPSR